MSKEVAFELEFEGYSKFDYVFPEKRRPVVHQLIDTPLDPPLKIKTARPCYVCPTIRVILVCSSLKDIYFYQIFNFKFDMTTPLLVKCRIPSVVSKQLSSGSSLEGKLIIVIHNNINDTYEPMESSQFTIKKKEDQKIQYQKEFELDIDYDYFDEWYWINFPKKELPRPKEDTIEIYQPSELDRLLRHENHDVDLLANQYNIIPIETMHSYQGFKITPENSNHGYYDHNCTNYETFGPIPMDDEKKEEKYQYTVISKTVTKIDSQGNESLPSSVIDVREFNEYLMSRLPEKITNIGCNNGKEQWKVFIDNLIEKVDDLEKIKTKYEQFLSKVNSMVE